MIMLILELDLDLEPVKVIFNIRLQDTLIKYLRALKPI